jgi:hypothetical protein
LVLQKKTTLPLNLGHDQILNNKELVQSIEVSEKEIAENRLLCRSEVLKEWGINEEAI